MANAKQSKAAELREQARAAEVDAVEADVERLEGELETAEAEMVEAGETVNKMVPTGPGFREAKDRRREAMAAFNAKEAKLREARKRLHGLREDGGDNA